MCRLYYRRNFIMKRKQIYGNNHNYIRDIIPNNYPMENLTQEDIELMFSHINSTPRLSLGGKTPYEVISFMFGKDFSRYLNISEIKRDKVILKPHLIYSKR